MCGICGYRSKRDVDLGRMSESLAHRGPDGFGAFRDPGAGVGLGHRRLAIIDLVTGEQPMSSPDRSVVLVYNGEIYNYQALRRDREAEGYAFRTTSDTEVLLAMYRRYGTDMLSRLNGMFAFVLYDSANDLLFGARDHLGIKPFYYCQNANGLFFASEAKALFESGRVPKAADAAGLDLYLTYRFVPGENTAFSGIKRLLPGHYFLQWGMKPLSIHRYWEISDGVSPMAEDEAIERFGELLGDSVRGQLVSDVPLGMFLSGGIDSTAIAGAMAGLGHSPIEAFTVGFRDGPDETAEAARSAAHFGCTHHTRTIAPESLNALPMLARHMDDPFGDAILVPLFELCGLAAREVKVVLSGDGVDEGQMGYIHHETLARIAGLMGRVPSALARLGGALAGIAPVLLLDKIFNYPDSMGPLGRQRLQRLTSGLASPFDCYQSFAALFTDEEKQRLYGPALRQGAEQAGHDFFGPMRTRFDTAPEALRAVYKHDLTHWLPDNILNKYDKMAMAHSIEGRVPYLDYRIVEFEACLPLDLKIRNGHGKFVLRRFFEKTYAIPGRKTALKQAFYFPLNGEYGRVFNALTEKYLAPDRIDTGLLRPEAVRAIVDRAGNSPLLGHKQVFALVMLQVWREAFGI